MKVGDIQHHRKEVLREIEGIQPAIESEIFLESVCWHHLVTDSPNIQ